MATDASSYRGGGSTGSLASVAAQFVDGSAVAKPVAAVERMRESWTIAAALMGGTVAMRAAGARFLPKWPKEEEATWRIRLAAATLYPAYQYTVSTLAAKPFSKPLQIDDDVPSRMKPWMDDIDAEGNNLHAFCHEVFEYALAFGISGILVDMGTADDVPETAAGIRTVAQEEQAGLRPYFVHIKGHQLLGWRTKKVNGRRVITQVRYCEYIDEDDGEYGTKEIEQIRVIEPSVWRTYRKDADRGTWVEYKSGPTSLDVVTFVPIYGKRVASMVGRPPLSELAHLNIKHWQSQSDQDTILHVARVPLLAFTGVDPSDTSFTLVVGSSGALKLPTGADGKYIEHTGSAIGAGKVSLDDLKEEMRQSGATMLVLQPGEVTATQVRSESEPAMCELQRMATMFDDSVAIALQYMAEWVKEANGGHVHTYKDFGVASLAEASASLLHTASTTGHLSRQGWFEEMQRRGIISSDRTWDDESDRMTEEGPPPGAELPAGPGSGPPTGAAKK